MSLRVTLLLRVSAVFIALCLVIAGSIAIPGACIGIFMGGWMLKKMELKPRGAIQFVLIANFICLSCYALLFFLGCDNLKMAGTTIPYFNNTHTEPFRVNLTSSCNFGCECSMDDVEPVCGNNGLTYFSPCHAGCTSILRSNYTNCTCEYLITVFPDIIIVKNPIYCKVATTSRNFSTVLLPDSF